MFQGETEDDDGDQVEHEPGAVESALTTRAELDAFGIDKCAGQLVQAMLEEIRHLSGPWAELSEAAQKLSIQRVQDRADKAIRQLVGLIVARDYPHVTLGVHRVVFSKAAQVTLGGTVDTKGEEVLSHLAGRRVMVVDAEPEAFLGGLKDAKAEPDQRSLLQ